MSPLRAATCTASSLSDAGSGASPTPFAAASNSDCSSWSCSRFACTPSCARPTSSRSRIHRPRAAAHGRRRASQAPDGHGLAAEQGAEHRRADGDRRLHLLLSVLRLLARDAALRLLHLLLQRGELRREALAELLLLGVAPL